MERDADNYLMTALVAEPVLSKMVDGRKDGLSTLRSAREGRSELKDLQPFDRSVAHMWFVKGQQ